MGKTLKNKVAIRRPRRNTVTTPAKAPPNGTASTVIRNFRAAMNFLNTRTNFEKMLRVGYNQTNFNLSRMQRILAALGHPEKKFRSLHVAGTKGKGSTCHMLAAMLKNANYRTGLYTSPHVLDINERIQINGVQISEGDFARVIGKVAPIVARNEKENPTFFEILTAAAFLYFANEEVDYAVIETGLGGRLDCTNVIHPEVCGIVNISIDHTAQLGGTVEQIAAEKAGIFKHNVPVICAPQTPSVSRVLRAAAEKVGAPIRFVGEELDFSYRFECSREAGPHMRVCMTTKNSRFDHVRVPMLGEHQSLNCAVALGMIDALREKGVPIQEQTAVDGLAGVQVPGRLEIIREQPRIVVDCAHNAASIAALMRAIGQNINCESMVVIFGCSLDKDIDGMLTQLQLGADKVIFTSNATPRSADPHDLLIRFQEKTQKMAQVGRTLKEAYAIAKHCVGREDLICITGSVYLVGEAKRLVAAGELA